MYTQHIIVDLEMNPVDRNFRDAAKLLINETIEIGAVKVNEKFEIVDKFDCFVNPEYNSHIERRIVKLTGIKTCDVAKALSFKDALSAFESWVGYNYKTRVYSWSDSDLLQIQRECSFKNIDFPKNLKRWMDFQAVYQRLMKLSSGKRRVSLKDAAGAYSILMDKNRVHNGLYDAEVTAELVIPVLNGEFKRQLECMDKYSYRSESTSDSIGDLCGGILADLLKEMNCSEVSA